MVVKRIEEVKIMKLVEEFFGEYTQELINDPLGSAQTIPYSLALRFSNYVNGAYRSFFDEYASEEISNMVGVITHYVSRANDSLIKISLGSVDFSGRSFLVSRGMKSSDIDFPRFCKVANAGIAEAQGFTVTLESVANGNYVERIFSKALREATAQEQPLSRKIA